VTTHASRATAHRQPVHQDGLFFHASLENKFLSASHGEAADGPVVELGMLGNERCRNLAVMDVKDVVD